MVEILGVTYNFMFMTLEIKEARKAELSEEIRAILDADHLDPGHAGKLKGKLMFAASQLWGKVGRAFLLAISERQYMKFRMYKDEAVAGYRSEESTGAVAQADQVRAAQRADDRL